MTRIYEVGDIVEFSKAGDKPEIWPAGTYASVIRSGDYVEVIHPTDRGQVYRFKPLDPDFRRVAAAADFKLDADGWITWAGGECPVPGDTVVEIRVCDRGTDIEKAKTYYWEWKAGGRGGDIVAYRVVKPAEAPLPVTMEPSTSDIRGVGMKFDSGKPRVDLVLSGFPRALLAVAEVATFGAAKYAEDSWVGVPDAPKRYAAAKDRHRLQGVLERDDPETNLRHAAHEAWNALAVLELALRAEGGA